MWCKVPSNTCQRQQSCLVFMNLVQVFRKVYCFFQGGTPTQSLLFTWLILAQSKKVEKLTKKTQPKSVAELLLWKGPSAVLPLCSQVVCWGYCTHSVGIWNQEVLKILMDKKKNQNCTIFKLGCWFGTFPMC